MVFLAEYIKEFIKGHNGYFIIGWYVDERVVLEIAD
jgi:hypothetical protein